MKVLLFTLILISLFGLPARAQGTDPGVREKVLLAKAEAIRVIREYSSNTKGDRQESEMTSHMADILEISSTAPADNRTMQRCLKNSKLQAVTGLNSHVVSLCPYALESDKNELVQIFIHESYHLYEGDYYYRIHKPELYRKFLANDFYMTDTEADDSERRAATMEIGIMLRTYGCVFYSSSYFQRLLGLVKNRDYLICK